MTSDTLDSVDMTNMYDNIDTELFQRKALINPSRISAGRFILFIAGVLIFFSKGISYLGKVESAEQKITLMLGAIFIFFSYFCFFLAPRSNIRGFFGLFLQLATALLLGIACLQTVMIITVL